MKKLFFIFLLGMLCSCDNDIGGKAPLIVRDVITYGGDWKYRLRVDCDACADKYGYIYTDSLYSVGDTLIITKK